MNAALIGTGGEATLVASYHVSQQNTQTGRLTTGMFDAALRAAVETANSSGVIQRIAQLLPWRRR